MSEVATYTVHAEFEGTTHSFSCREDQTVLNAAEAAGIPPVSYTHLTLPTKA